MAVQFELFTFCHYAYTLCEQRKPLVPDVHCSHIRPIGFDCPVEGKNRLFESQRKTFRYGFVDLRSSHFAGEEPRVGISRGLGHFLRSYVSVLLVDSAGWWTGKSRGARRS
jgi:hypothetical protein